jgi:hypothetical protein
MEELEGIVVRKCSIKETIPIIPMIPVTPQFEYSPYLGKLTIDRMYYEIDANGKLYEVITRGECKLPERAKIRIRRRGRILKDTYLLYEDEEFPVIEFNPKKQEN